MGTIDSKKLNAALAKARNIGLVEEACTIGGCDLVLRSLRSEDYTAVLQDCDGIPEEEYVHRYQKGHIARSIVEINGLDLRESRLVAVEEPDPATGTMRTVQLELHQYLIKHVLDTWGKEVTDIAFRKLGDVLEIAERQAKQGIKFLIPDESAEEKFRRLILEARAVDKELPESLLDKILDEQGLTRKATSEELKRVGERTEQLAREQEVKGSEAPAAPTEAQPIQPASTVARAARPVDPHATLQNAIAVRKALDVPTVKSEQAADVKPQVSRSEAIGALEGDGEVVPDLSAAVSLQGGDPNEVIEIKRAPLDVQAAGAILDKQPVAGINPRFRPVQRG